VRKARRLLGDRRDPEVIAPLRALILETADHHLALEALWALYVSGGFDEQVAASLLVHSDPQVRRWTVRLLGDEGQVSPLMAQQLVELAGKEPEVTVRSQLASTARRLPAKDGLAIVQRILVRNLDAQDAFVPLLCWWAVEQNAISSRDDVLEMFASPAAFQAPMVRDVILGRLMRRFAAEGTEAALSACARVLASAPANDRTQMLAALDQGLQERPTELARADSEWKPPPELEAQLTQLWSDTISDTALIRVAARLGRVSAYDRALELALDSRASAEVRISMLQLLASAGNPACVGPVLKVLASAPTESIQLAALDALQPFEGEEISATVIRQYASMAARVRSRARELLLSRKPWARDFLHEVDQEKIPAKEVPVDQLTRIALFQDKQLNELVHKLWGNIGGGTPGEKLAVVRRFNNDVRAGSGDKAHGRELFTKTCSVCHRLFDEGGAIGPDLTHANRSDRDFLLTSIVDPSAVIRKEFLSYIVETTDGRVLTGLIAEQTPASITLLAVNNERTVLSRDKIKSLQELPVSLMPENLLQALNPQELRDLFSYLQSDKP
jgi:putative heme-binding domain-containing protein